MLIDNAHNLSLRGLWKKKQAISNYQIPMKAKQGGDPSGLLQKLHF